MQELSYEWMLHSRSLMLKRGKWQDLFFFPLLDILSLQQAQPSNVSREVKTSLSVFFMWVCERNLSVWSCTGIDTINLNGSFTTVRVFCKHMLSCQPTSFKPGCWAQQMVYPADTHATNSYFNTQLCCLNEATASWKVLKLLITGNHGEVNCDGRGRLQRGGPWLSQEWAFWRCSLHRYELQTWVLSCSASCQRETMAWLCCINRGINKPRESGPAEQKM